ncbi:MAG: NAD(P)-dependent oxidoreductase, partial [Chitinophagaceae bacterium]|nr:NAD(P)-dependent oxidoreductase [Chitinophagaceae bacterium]
MLHSLENIPPLLIIGKNGTLGKAFAKISQQRQINYKLLCRDDCDISEAHTIESVIDFYKPSTIINAAGYVRVDDAEKEIEKCFRENALGSHNLSSACKAHGIKLVTFSSDLVFDGQKKTPYIETDEVNPLNVYGRSKAESERLVLQQDPSALVIRTSAFFGPWDQYNFVHSVIENLSRNQYISVADDVYISPTYVPHLVYSTLDLLIDGESGIWHLSNQGSITWADLAYEVARRAGLNETFISALPLEFLNYEAPRPNY